MHNKIKIGLFEPNENFDKMRGEDIKNGGDGEIPFLKQLDFNHPIFSTIQKVTDNHSIYSQLPVSDINSVSPLCELHKEGKAVIIVYVRMRDLCNTEFYKYIRKTYTQTVNANNYFPCPIVIIGIEDISPLFNDENCLEIYTQNEFTLQKEVLNALTLDKRVNFFDASIWHYYVPLDDEFLRTLKNVLEDINNNYENCLYKTNVGKEYLEFQSRLMKNSYLVDLGEHATDVTPFKFHSETELKDQANKLTKKLSEHKWRLLLVDDYADKVLKPLDSKSNLTKNKVIEKVLNCSWIEIITCESVEEFIRLYSTENKKGKIHDIILLDYLLGDNTTGGAGREYSTDILMWIKRAKEYNNNLIGPLGKFWFFPISVFSFAFMEDIRKMGFTQLEEEWYIARGADPVNTPELFRYSLFKFMVMQVKEANKYKKACSGKREVGINQYLSDKLSIRTFFESYFPESNNYKSIQSAAKIHYHKYLSFQDIYENLRKDNINGSIFAKYIMTDTFMIDDAFWGHLHHLIFMLGHEPANEWPKLWDEFNIVKEQLIKYEKKEETDEIEYINPIKNYIINLQKITRGIS